MDINASVLRDIASLFGNESAMQRLQTYVRTLKREQRQEQQRLKTSVVKARTADPAREELKADLREALQELKDARAGRVQLRDAEELLYEL